MLSAILLTVCTDCAACPHGKCPKERPNLMMPRQECNILGDHIGAGKIGLYR